MRKDFPEKLKLGLITIAISLHSMAGAQTIPSPKVESPTVAGFNKFGDIPVNLFTGTPDITLPIHTLTYGKINVPIALRYHSGSVRPAQHPGWVGLGWDLQSFGCITRNIRFYPDEVYATDVTYPPSFYPAPGQAAGASGSEMVDASDWYTTAKFGTYFTGSTITDVTADEFSFNFLGYSGKFYFISPSKGWQVVADQNIKVELTDAVNPCLSQDEVITSVSQYYPYMDIGPTYQEGQSRQFKGFTITVPDGTKYYFGGSNALEFYTLYGIAGVHFVANSWLLTRIVDVNNNEVDFQYRRGHPTCDLNFGFSANSWDCQQTGGGFMSNNTWSSGWSTGTVDVNTHSGMMQLPMYLTQITSPNETISFTEGTAGCLRYPDLELEEKKVGVSGGTNTFYLGLLHNSDLSNLQWEQLNNIVITNTNSAIYRQYQFNYSNTTTQRLTLNTVNELDNAGSLVAQYSFGYNHVENLPGYEGDYTDHWGFYNGQSVAGAQPSQIFALRQTNAAYVLTGLLTQITYPTGGHTTLTWEPHDYSQVVSLDRQSLVSGTGIAGGSRVKEIQGYLADGTLASDKKYYYKRGYSAGATIGSLPSSGILNGLPIYDMKLQNRPGFVHGTIESIEVASLNPLGIYGYNGAGSYIGYDEVAEVAADGSYTRNFFTSYGPDLNNVAHYDVPPVNSAGWLLGADTYFPMSTLEVERGKPIGTFSYTPANTLVRKTVNTYRSDAARFNNYIKIIDFGGSYSGCAAFDALLLASARKQFTYSYYPVNKKVTTYDQLGNNPVVESLSYSYNVNNQVNAETKNDSKGTTTTTYKYPADEADAVSVSMTSAHILSPVIEETVLKNGILSTYAHTNYYSPYTNIYLPQNVQLQIGNNSAIETRQQFYQYDSHGNLQEQSKTNDTHEVYLWSYNAQYLVAKITGSTYSAVNGLVTQAQIDAATSSDANMRSLLNTLRTGLPNALVTTYTWSPVIGLTSETNPRGQTTYYQYDSFQRLRSIADQDGNILKTFTYQY